MNLLYSSLILMLATLLITMTRQLHMLQLNSYFNSRFFDYVINALSAKTLLSIVVYIITIPLIFKSPLLLLVFISLTGVIRCTKLALDMKNAKKKLVLTARIKRMYLTAALLFILLVVLAVYSGSKFNLMIYCFAENLMVLLSPFVTMLVNIINSPIEKAIAAWYLNDAKNILKQMPDLKVIGVTGSYGKTSTKYILGRLLLEKYNVTITPESYNTLMGVVRTVRERLKSETQVFVVEMGAKKPGDIKEICDLVHPKMGVLTSVGPQHLNTFKTIDNIVNTKFELSNEVVKNEGTMFFNNDNEYIKDKSKDINAVRYGIESDCCEFYAENISCGKQGLSFDICTKKRRIPVTTKLLGSHNVLNILAAAAVAIKLGLKDFDIKFAVSQLTPVAHRLQMKPFIGGSVLIDDAYNANPEGSIEAVKVLGSFNDMKRIIVTPGMVELGEKEYECNFKLGAAAASYCDTIILVGEKRSVPLAEGVRSKQFPEENLHIVPAFSDALNYLRGICDKDTVVLFENDLPDNYEN